MRGLRQALRFFLVGTGGTAAYAGLYLVLAPVVPDPAGLVLAWLVSTLATNLAHRHVTFALHAREGWIADAVVFFGTSLLGLGLTQLVLGWKERTPLGEVAVIVTATGLAGVVRFAAMRLWLGRARIPLRARPARVR